MTPEERAKAVVAYFPAIPEQIRRGVEGIIARAIRRAVVQEVAVLEREADRQAITAEGRGKSARGQDVSALRTHRWWEERLRKVRLAMAGPGAIEKQERERARQKEAQVIAAASERLLRVRRLQAGDVVTVHRCQGAYTELPEGLPENTRVTVVKTDIGTVDVIDVTGKEFMVFLPQIEMPCDVWWKGKWIDRLTHPEGEEAYQWALGKKGEARKRLIELAAEREAEA